VCNLLLVVYAIGSISRFHCVAFFLFFVFVCMCVCVWATLPDLNKMDGWMVIKVNITLLNFILSSFIC